MDLDNLGELILQEMADNAEEFYSNEKFEVECDHCKAIVSVPVGKSPCPNCSKEIELQLNLKL